MSGLGEVCFFILRRSQAGAVVVLIRSLAAAYKDNNEFDTDMFLLF